MAKRKRRDTEGDRFDPHGRWTGHPGWPKDLHPVTVDELLEWLEDLSDRGLGDLPMEVEVAGTDDLAPYEGGYCPDGPVVGLVMNLGECVSPVYLRRDPNMSSEDAFESVVFLRIGAFTPFAAEVRLHGGDAADDPG